MERYVFDLGMGVSVSDRRSSDVPLMKSLRRRERVMARFVVRCEYEFFGSLALAKRSEACQRIARHSRRLLGIAEAMSVRDIQASLTHPTLPNPRYGGGHFKCIRGGDVRWCRCERQTKQIRCLSGKPEKNIHRFKKNSRFIFEKYDGNDFKKICCY